MAGRVLRDFCSSISPFLDFHVIAFISLSIKTFIVDVIFVNVLQNSSLDVCTFACSTILAWNKHSQLLNNITVENTEYNFVTYTSRRVKNTVLVS